MYNVCQAEIVTLRHFVELIADKARYDFNAVSVPSDVAETCSDLPWEDWSFDFFSRPPVFVFSIEKARLDIGLHCTPMSEWVGQTVDWYKEHHDGSDSPFYDRRDDEVAFARWWREKYGQFIENLEAPK